MSIVFVVLTVVVVFVLGLLLRPADSRQVANLAKRQPSSEPAIENEPGTDIPKTYRLHPCHTWAVDEGNEIVRVGLDSFAVKLFDKIDRIDIPALNCWVRQGQNLMTVTGDGISVDFPSPVEGPLTAVNRAVIADPQLLTADPYREGWVAVIKSPCFAIDKKNLMQGGGVSHWMRTSEVVLQEMCSLTPAFGQDGGILLSGVLKRLSPEVRKRVLKEMFMSSMIEVHRKTT